MLWAAAPAWFRSRGKVWLIHIPGQDFSQRCSGVHFSDLPVKIRLLWLWGAASHSSSVPLWLTRPVLYFQLPLFLPLPAAYVSTLPETRIWISNQTLLFHSSVCHSCASLLRVSRVLALSLPLVFLILMLWFRPSPAFLPVSCPAKQWDPILHKGGQWARSKLGLNRVLLLFIIILYLSRKYQRIFVDIKEQCKAWGKRGQQCGKLKMIYI